MNTLSRIAGAMLLTLVFAGLAWYSIMSESPSQSAPSPTASALQTTQAEFSARAAVATNKPIAEGESASFNLEEAEDYSLLKAHVELAAQLGDPKAKRTLALINDYCAGYSVSPENFSRQLEVIANIRPEYKRQLDAIREGVERRCSKLDDGSPITSELINWSWNDAAVAGDPVAMIRVATTKDDLNGVQVDELIDKVLPAAEPEVLFEIGNLVGAKQSSYKYEKYSDPYFGRYTWQVLACRRSNSNLCGANSTLMTALCMNGICGGMSYEQMVMAALPAADQARLNKLVMELDSFTSGQGR